MVIARFVFSYLWNPWGSLRSRRAQHILRVWRNLYFAMVDYIPPLESGNVVFQEGWIPSQVLPDNVNEPWVYQLSPEYPEVAVYYNSLPSSVGPFPLSTFPLRTVVLTIQNRTRKLHLVAGRAINVTYASRIIEFIPCKYQAAWCCNTRHTRS